MFKWSKTNFSIFFSLNISKRSTVSQGGWEVSIILINAPLYPKEVGKLALFSSMFCWICWSDDTIFLLALFHKKLFKLNAIFLHKTSVPPYFKCVSSLAKRLRAMLLFSMKKSRNESHAFLLSVFIVWHLYWKLFFLYIRLDMIILLTPWDWYSLLISSIIFTMSSENFCFFYHLSHYILFELLLYLGCHQQELGLHSVLIVLLWAL